MSSFTSWLIGVVGFFCGLALVKVWDIYSNASTIDSRSYKHPKASFLLIMSGGLFFVGLLVMYGLTYAAFMTEQHLRQAAEKATKIAEHDAERNHAGWQNTSNEVARLQYRIDKGMAGRTTEMYNRLVDRFNELTAAHNRLLHTHWQIRKYYLKPNNQYQLPHPLGRRFNNQYDFYYDDPFLPRNFSPDNVREVD